MRRAWCDQCGGAWPDEDCGLCEASHAEAEKPPKPSANYANCLRIAGKVTALSIKGEGGTVKAEVLRMQLKPLWKSVTPAEQEHIKVLLKEEVDRIIGPTPTDAEMKALDDLCDSTPMGKFFVHHGSGQVSLAAWHLMFEPAVQSDKWLEFDGDPNPIWRDVFRKSVSRPIHVVKTSDVKPDERQEEFMLAALNNVRPLVHHYAKLRLAFKAYEFYYPGGKDHRARHTELMGLPQSRASCGHDAPEGAPCCHLCANDAIEAARQGDGIEEEP